MTSKYLEKLLPKFVITIQKFAPVSNFNQYGEICLPKDRRIRKKFRKTKY